MRQIPLGTIPVRSERGEVHGPGPVGNGVVRLPVAFLFLVRGAFLEDEDGIGGGILEVLEQDLPGPRLLAPGLRFPDYHTAAGRHHGEGVHQRVQLFGIEGAGYPLIEVEVALVGLQSLFHDGPGGFLFQDVFGTIQIEDRSQLSATQGAQQVVIGAAWHGGNIVGRKGRGYVGPLAVSH